MLYTSYFANLKNIDKTKYKIVTICNSKPVFLQGDSSIEDWGILGPSLDLLYGYKNGKYSEQDYINIYTEYILNNWEKLNNIFKFEEQNNLVMLCYEGPNKFCHRHILANILNNKNILCEEFKNDNER